MTSVQPEVAPSPRPRLLCVDDDPRVLRVLQRMLRVEYEMVVSTSGDEAVRLLREDNFDLLLTDMRMPGMSGAELCIAAKEIAPEIPRVVLTGYADPESMALAHSRGGLFRVLEKPCPRELLRTVLAEAAAHGQRPVTQ